MNLQYTEALISRHEQYRSKAYFDSRGNLTVGVGYKLDQPGAVNDLQSIGADYYRVRAQLATLTNKQIDALFQLVLGRVLVYCVKLVSNFDALPDVAQAVIADMVYNVGPTKFAEFTHTIAAFERLDFAGAAAQMRASLWCGEVGTRCTEDCALILGLAGGNYAMA